ncbi:MAG: ribosomal protein S18-alanine N-acetyltransferase [Chloroflexota bacterium]|nr:ribosomal protein S18-alanine N-acetyltransferase [Chloroflexota bacterium]MDE2941421.1 ribosomal protein S18-alanine N-acetyltransferase [Chloroflexota bacterium]MDE3267661.1 ribosomal protein S18-alanine N-acetyltransferase [Chloroflexota bacterium]
MPYAIRFAREEDVPQLAEIEKEAFPTNWPATPFRRDLSRESISLLVVYTLPEEDNPPPPEPDLPAGDAEQPRGLAGLLARIFRGRNHRQANRGPAEFIAGYVSTSYMTDEAHVTGIAVRGLHRGNGLGELLLMSAIELAMRKNSRVVTLEVRVSNRVAQSLYTKYGFNQAGLRKGYYTDNHEDAYIMTTAPISSLEYGEKFRTLEQSYRQRRGYAAISLG